MDILLQSKTNIGPDCENLILDYKAQLEFAEKYDRVIEELMGQYGLFPYPPEHDRYYEMDEEMWTDWIDDILKGGNYLWVAYGYGGDECTKPKLLFER